MQHFSRYGARLVEERKKESGKKEREKERKKERRKKERKKERKINDSDFWRFRFVPLKWLLYVAITIL